MSPCPMCDQIGSHPRPCPHSIAEREATFDPPYRRIRIGDRKRPGGSLRLNVEWIPRADWDAAVDEIQRLRVELAMMRKPPWMLFGCTPEHLRKVPLSDARMYRAMLQDVADSRRMIPAAEAEACAQAQHILDERLGETAGCADCDVLRTDLALRDEEVSRLRAELDETEAERVRETEYGDDHALAHARLLPALREACELLDLAGIAGHTAAGQGERILRSVGL